MENFAKYVLLDGARIGEAIRRGMSINEQFDSLYRLESEKDLSSVSPYLFSFSDKEEFSIWLFENGWGNSWGVIVAANVSFVDCWKHFRKFLMIKTESGQDLYFRFYDPRVLKIFLPTCESDQIIEFFGPIKSFFVEGDIKEEAIQFWQENGVLRQKAINSEQLFNNVL